MDRRTFFLRAGGGLTLAALAACAGLPYVAADEVPGGIRVAASRMEGQEFVLVEGAPGRPPILLARDADGALMAVSLRCTHRGCIVQPAGAELHCPCHGSRYARGGALLEGPAERDLARFEVQAGADGITILTA